MKLRFLTDLSACESQNKYDEGAIFNPCYLCLSASGTFLYVATVQEAFLGTIALVSLEDSVRQRALLICRCTGSRLKLVGATLSYMAFNKIDHTYACSFPRVIPRLEVFSKGET